MELTAPELTPEQQKAIQVDSATLLAKVEAYNECNTPEQAQEGAEYLCFSHDRVKRAEALRDEQMKKLRDSVKSFDTMFKQLIKPYETSKSKVKGLLKAYMIVRRQQSLAEYKKLKETDPLAIVEMPDPVIQTVLGNVHVRRSKRMEVDTEKLPKEFWRLEIDSAKIQEAIDKGQKPEGVEIIEDIDIVPLNHKKNEK